jgi:hypothetical protein
VSLRGASLVGLGLLIASGIVAASARAQAPPDTASLALVKVAEVGRRLAAGERVVLVDVRTEEEYRARRLRGAVSIPLHALEARYREIPRQGLVVLY